MESWDFVRVFNLQACEQCEKYAHIDLMHSHGDAYICQICKDSIK